MDIPAMFRAAVAEFDARVRQIGDGQWQAATPDEDWAVRDLVIMLPVRTCGRRRCWPDPRSPR